MTSALLIVVVDHYPEGYPHLSAFLNSYEGFTMFRRFGYLQCRLLLEKQTRLSDLELQLDNLDELESETHSCSVMTVTNQPQDERRVDLMSRIKQTFCEYCK